MLSVARSPGRPNKWSPCACVMKIASRCPSRNGLRISWYCVPSAQSKRSERPSRKTASDETLRSRVGVAELVPNGTMWIASIRSSLPRRSKDHFQEQEHKRCRVEEQVEPVERAPERAAEKHCPLLDEMRGAEGNDHHRDRDDDDRRVRQPIEPGH